MPVQETTKKLGSVSGRCRLYAACACYLAFRGFLPGLSMRCWPGTRRAVYHIARASAAVALCAASPACAGLVLGAHIEPLRFVAPASQDTTIAAHRRSRRDPARPVALLEARRRKEATYPELLASARCRLVVIGVEVGGRWGSEAASFLRLLARARARAAPRPFALPFEVLMSTDGPACCALQLRLPLLTASLPCPPLACATLMGLART